MGAPAGKALPALVVGRLSSRRCCCLSAVLQDRLSQQQRDMEEERSRLQEVIAKMEARLSEQTRLLEQVSACRVLWVRGGWMMPLLGLEPANGTCLSSVPGPGAVEGDSRAIQGGIAAALAGGAEESDDPAALHGASGAGEGEGEVGQASPGAFHISQICLGLHCGVWWVKETGAWLQHPSSPLRLLHPTLGLAVNLRKQPGMWIRGARALCRVHAGHPGFDQPVDVT